VVIGIIALLISILLPSLNKARERGKAIACLSNLRSFGNALTMYANENRGRVPLGYTSFKHNGYLIWQSGRFQVLGTLYESGHLATPQAYFCPSKEDSRWQFATPDNPWPPSPAAVQIRLGMTVRPAVVFDFTAPRRTPSPNDHPNLQSKFPQITQFTGKAIAAEMFGEPFTGGASVNPAITSHPKQINVLYADSSASAMPTSAADRTDPSITIQSLLQRVYDLRGLPSGNDMNQIYLDENATPKRGIWHLFDTNR
jgi:type II secretory pathway pseudopilin PulG